MAGRRVQQLTTLLRAVRGRPALPALGAADRAHPLAPGVPGSQGPASSGPRSRDAQDPPGVDEVRLRDVLDALDPRRRRQVLAPLDVPVGGLVRWGSAAARQVDGTTCGAAVLGLLAAAGDSVLAAWLVTGELPDDVVPPELDGLALPEPPAPDAPDAPTWYRSPDDRLVHATATPAEASATRWGLLQASVHRRSTARAVAGVLPWPRSLGTPPWCAARVARFPGVRYRAVLVDDTRTVEVEAVLDAVDAALDVGVPVPLYAGGDLSDGVGSAVPRHVVLAVGRTGDGYRVYEPGAGRVLTLPRAALLHPDGPQRALGGWTHLAWAVLPRPAR